MSDIPEEIFQVVSSDGRATLIAAARTGLNVGLFASLRRGGAVTIAPTEARDLAAELIRLADEADALRPDGEPRPPDPGGEEDAGGEAGKQAREHEGT